MQLPFVQKKKISIQTSGLILKNKSNVCLTVFLPTSPLTILLLKSNMVSCCCSGIFNEKLVNYLKKDQSFSTDTLQSLEIILSIIFVPTFGDTLLNHRALYLWWTNLYPNTGNFHWQFYKRNDCPKSTISPNFC